jgi:hypothetical protein
MVCPSRAMDSQTFTQRSGNDGFGTHYQDQTSPGQDTGAIAGPLSAARPAGSAPHAIRVRAVMSGQW